MELESKQGFFVCLFEVFFVVYQHLSKGFFEAFDEGWVAVGIDGAEIALKGIEQPGDEEPLLAAGERLALLREEITHCDVSLTEGYGVTFRIRLCVCLPTWAAQRSRTVACAMPSMPSLSMARKDGVNLN